MNSNSLRHRRLRLSLFPALLAIATIAARADSPGDPPRLVVVVVVDQLRADFLTRFERLFCKDGFRRVMREGAHFANAYYSYGSTATGPGHATISTGREPSSHGIVANRCYDIDVNGVRASVWDRSAKLVGAEQKQDDDGRSSHRLLAPALGDQLKVSDRRSRVFSISLKDRAAILLGGHHPDGAYWLHDSTGAFITSTYYRDALPPYVQAFNAEHRTEQYAGKIWTHAASDEAYAGCHPNEPFQDKQRLPSLGLSFPHQLPILAGKANDDFYDAVWSTPYGNDIVLDFSLRLIEEERLGAGPATDLIWIGLSSNDLCGHLYGAESEEVMDMTLWTDRQIARLLAELDKRVGRGRYLFAVTSDHGVTTAAPLASALKLGGELIDLKDVENRLNSELLSALDKTGVVKPTKVVQGIELPWVFLDRKIVDGLSSKQRDALLTRGASFLKTCKGIRAVLTETNLRTIIATSSTSPDVGQLAARRYQPGRSGQFYIQLDDYWYKKRDHFAGHTTGTTHDQHVPILLMGPGIKPGRYFTPANPADLVVTLAAILGIEPPLNATGAILGSALDTAPPAVSATSE